ncbi:unnamed protein product [Rotaria magnacalcarata]|uniref:Legumain prodomain domain-containing protein n=1 Tax=Rotaria magnacalcarata TaxID=392030 RepID=A0A8S2NRI2_9BILA|nr:unnamed protein product [Rotaria magnacalcarata]
MYRQLLLPILCLVLFGISFSWAANWAVLVAGSRDWVNYRHQADVCHAYQILHKNGIPDSNIVVMMYDDLAHHWRNPTKGIIINHPKGNDVYHGVPHDYTGKDVTPENFMNVLLGNQEAMRNIGSGKVLESGPDDNVFIYYTDHGAVGTLWFSCFPIWRTSNAQESSYACYHDVLRGTYLGDVYSVVWMEDSDAEMIDKETLYQQYLITQSKTNASHVMQYGDLNLAKSHNVSEFQGVEKSNVSKYNNFIDQYNSLLRRDAVRSEDVRIEIIKHRLTIVEVNSIEEKELTNELTQLYKDRNIIFHRIYQIASTVLSLNRENYLEMILEKRMKLTQHDCYISVTQRIHEKCFDLQNEFVLNKLYIMANLCEIGLLDITINQAIDEVCNHRIYFDY